MGSNGLVKQDDRLRLEVAVFPVTRLEASERTEWQDGRLSVNTTELERLLAGDKNFASVRIGLASPGDPTRIVHALDVIEPRVKVSGTGSIFPGLMGSGVTAGGGRTHRSAGCAVITAGELLTDDEGLKVREAIIDMSGPGAPFSPFGSTFNVVIECKLADRVSLAEGEESFRLAGLRAAVYLAETTRDQRPAEVEQYELTPPARPLPKVAYLCQLMTVGITQNKFVYGHGMLHALPTVLHPNELMDGALVNANFHFASIRTPTYMHQNDPVVRELYRRHAHDVDFVGVVVAPGYALGSEKKERHASFAAKLARVLGANGVVITQEGGGHGGVDVMLMCQQAAKLGMQPVILMNEMADVDGGDPGLVYAVPEADAIASTGNREELIELPEVATVLGGATILDTYEPAEARMMLPIRQIYTSTSQVGGMRLAVASY